MQQTVLRRQASKPDGKTGDPAEQIMHRLSRRIGSHKFDMWFAHVRTSVQGQKIEIATDSGFAARWIEGSFREEIARAAREVIGCEVTIEVIVAADIAASSNDRASGSGSSSAGTGAKLPGLAGRGSAVSPARFRQVRAHRSLSDFVVGTSNRLAYMAACRLCEDVDPHLHSPLFIHGPCGVGKTHLLQGACKRFSERWPSARVRYVPAEQFTNEYIAAVRNGKIDDFRRRARRIDFVAIDDVHFLSNKMRTQTEFHHTVDALAMSGARIVFASDGHPRQITSFSHALVSRFMSGMVVQIELPDREMRAQLARKIAAGRGLVLADPAAEAIASRCIGTARELEGAIARIAAIRELHESDSNEPVGLLLVEQVLGSGGGAGAAIGGDLSTGPVRIADVIGTVCERLNVERAELVGGSRHKRVVLARALVAHLAREMTTMSYPEIAQAMGRRHHSTIHTAAQRVRKQLNSETRLAASAVGGPPEIALVDFVDQLRHSIGRAKAN